MKRLTSVLAALTLLVSGCGEPVYPKHEVLFGQYSSLTNWKKTTECTPGAYGRYDYSVIKEFAFKDQRLTKLLSQGNDGIKFLEASYQYFTGDGNLDLEERADLERQIGNLKDYFREVQTFSEKY